MGRVKRKRSWRKRCFSAALAKRIDKVQEVSKGKDSFLRRKARSGNGRGIERAGLRHGRLLRNGVTGAGGAEVQQSKKSAGVAAATTAKPRRGSLILRTVA